MSQHEKLKSTELTHLTRLAFLFTSVSFMLTSQEKTVKKPEKRPSTLSAVAGESVSRNELGTTTFKAERLPDMTGADPRLLCLAKSLDNFQHFFYDVTSKKNL